MDEVARLMARDRADLFVAAAGRRGLSVEIIEKDFWVCWMLRRLFTLPNLPAGLIFKGGTSLSKAYKAIDRFSEDVDLSFDRGGLGFGGENDPLRAKSGKKKKHGVEALQETCQKVIRETFLPQLTAAVVSELGPAPGPPIPGSPWFEVALASEVGQHPSGNWALEMDREDPDGQTLLFHYPQSGRPRPAEEAAYLKPFVRLE